MLSFIYAEPEQISKGFNRIECFYRNFHKNCIPIAYNTVSQARQLECFQLPTVLALLEIKPIYDPLLS